VQSGRPESSKIPISCSPDIRANKGFGPTIELCSSRLRYTHYARLHMRTYFPEAFSDVHVKPWKFDSFARISYYIDTCLHDVRAMFTQNIQIFSVKFINYRCIFMKNSKSYLRFIIVLNFDIYI